MYDFSNRTQTCSTEERITFCSSYRTGKSKHRGLKNSGINCIPCDFSFISIFLYLSINHLDQFLKHRCFYRRKSYNPSTHVCCSGTISPKPAQCCGRVPYNPNTQACCGGGVSSTSGISSPACCGNTVYDRNQKVLYY